MMDEGLDGSQQKHKALACGAQSAVLPPPQRPKLSVMNSSLSIDKRQEKQAAASFFFA